MMEEDFFAGIGRVRRVDGVVDSLSHLQQCVHDAGDLWGQWRILDAPHFYVFVITKKVMSTMSTVGNFHISQTSDSQVSCFAYLFELAIKHN